MPYHKSIEDKLKSIVKNDNDLINLLDTFSDYISKVSVDKQLEGYRHQANRLQFIARLIERETRDLEMITPACLDVMNQ